MRVRQMANRWWRKFIGYEDCPCCGEQSLTWHKVHILHPEEPPMFGWWHCEACDRATDVLPTGLMDKAAASLGYRNFDEWVALRARAHEQVAPGGPPCAERTYSAG